MTSDYDNKVISEVFPRLQSKEAFPIDVYATSCLKELPSVSPQQEKWKRRLKDGRIFTCFFSEVLLNLTMSKNESYFNYVKIKGLTQDGNPRQESVAHARD